MRIPSLFINHHKSSSPQKIEVYPHNIPLIFFHISLAPRPVLIRLRLLRRISVEGAPQAPLQQRQRLRRGLQRSQSAMELTELTELTGEKAEKGHS